MNVFTRCGVDCMCCAICNETTFNVDSPWLWKVRAAWVLSCATLQINQSQSTFLLACVEKERETQVCM